MHVYNYSNFNFIDVVSEDELKEEMFFKSKYKENIK